MRFRKLQIAFSAACAIACVLLIVLCHSFPQPVIPGTSPRPSGLWNTWRLEELRFGRSQALLKVHHPVDPKLNLAKTLTFDMFGFAWQRTYWTYWIAIPYWFLIATSAIVGYCLPAVPTALYAATKAPWPKRFSLRTLLIATTLVAVVLGLVVYLVRTH
jgi:hypothetical protein